MPQTTTLRHRALEILFQILTTVENTYYLVLSDKGNSFERSKQVRIPTSFHKVITWSQYSCNRRQEGKYFLIMKSAIRGITNACLY